MARVPRSPGSLVTLEYPDEDLTGVIIGAAYAVHNDHGFGFLE